MFTRSGGVSKEPYDSLNLSFHVGDHPEKVALNRETVKNILNLKTLVSAKQIHGDRVKCIEKADQDEEVDDCDALITGERGVGLLIQQADCQAILLYHPPKNIIAAIHCGWRGSVFNIIKKTISKMINKYKINPGELLAVISPSLGPCCSEFINYRTELPFSFNKYQLAGNHFNFWKSSCDQLTRCGVLQKNIDITDICTMCNNNFFSYRRARKRGLENTGRNGSVISLQASPE